MNLDKKLSKYVKFLGNPKYYGKIIDIIDKADGIGYEFKSFTQDDLDDIVDILYDYYSVFETDEKHKQMVKYCNSLWFIVSDKHYILAKTPYLTIALSIYIRSYMILFFSKISRLINPAHFFECDNVESDLYIFHGGLKAVEYIGCDITDLEENLITV